MHYTTKQIMVYQIILLLYVFKIVLFTTLGL